MTPAEFRHWLEGFRDAGGTDIDVILAKAREIKAEVKMVPAGPAHPLPITPVWPQPYTPAAPNPWYNPPLTADPPWKVGEIFCGSSLPVDFADVLNKNLWELYAQ